MKQREMVPRLMMLNHVINIALYQKRADQSMKRNKRYNSQTYKIFDINHADNPVTGGS